MLVITILKLSWGPNDFYAFLRYFFDSVIRDYALKGAVIIYGGGWHRREMFFVAKILLTQPLKNQKFDYPTSSII